MTLIKLRHILPAALAFAAAGIANAQTARPEQAEAVTWPSVVCAGQPTVCTAMPGQGFLFAKPGQTKVVMISHGSQGIDSRMYDYVDSLQKEGFAALVINHWGPRGIGVTHEDYLAASAKGGNNFNMAFDSYTAAAWLRDARGFEKVGSMGESQGGASSLDLQQKWTIGQIERNTTRIYGRPFKAGPIDAVVGLYGYCGLRRAHRDAFVNTPYLMIAGAEDDETPPEFCERYVKWMNERGEEGNARIIVIPGEGHSFDAPYKRQLNMFNPGSRRCDLMVDEKGVTNLATGENVPGDNVNALLARCQSASKGFHSGYWKDRFIAVPYWIAFFRQNL